MTVITTVAQLQDMDLDLTGDYELGCNIDASATVGWNGGLGFEPIGTGVDFTGRFDGKGFTINGLFINRPAIGSVGLFGVIDGVTISSVTLANIDITGKYLTAGLVGCTQGIVAISNCHVGGSIKAFNSSGEVGGIIGCSYGTLAISACSVDGSIGIHDYVDSMGGIIGQNRANLIITNSYSNASVIGDDYVGGLIGISGWGGIVNMKRCFSIGDVTGHSWGAGGLIGDSYHVNDSITDCYARGDIVGDEGVGGAFGSFYNGTYGNVYSTGAVIGNTDVGGLHGYGGGTEEITPCFWDTQTSGQAASVGGTGKTTAEMKAIATILEAGWSIPSIWNISLGCNSGYPCLVGVNACCGDSAVAGVDPTIAPKCVTLELIRNLEMMNNSRGYISKTGNFVYESRYHR